MKDQIKELANDIAQMCPNLCEDCCGDVNCVSCLAKGIIKQGYRKEGEVERLTVELKAMRGTANAYKMHYERLKAEKDNLIKTYAECMKDVAKEIFDGLKTGLKDRIKSFQISTLEFEKGLCAAYARTLAEVEFMEKKYIGD